MISIDMAAIPLESSPRHKSKEEIQRLLDSSKHLSNHINLLYQADTRPSSPFSLKQECEDDTKPRSPFIKINEQPIDLDPDLTIHTNLLALTNEDAFRFITTHSPALNGYPSLNAYYDDVSESILRIAKSRFRTDGIKALPNFSPFLIETMPMIDLSYVPHFLSTHLNFLLTIQDCLQDHTPIDAKGVHKSKQDIIGDQYLPITDNSYIARVLKHHLIENSPALPSSVFVFDKNLSLRTIFRHPQVDQKTKEKIADLLPTILQLDYDIRRCSRFYEMTPTIFSQSNLPIREEFGRLQS